VRRMPVVRDSIETDAAWTQRTPIFRSVTRLAR